MQEAEIKAAIREAVACYQSGDFARAEQIYRRIIAEAPAAVHYTDLGVFLKAQGKHEDAVAAYNKAIDLDPSDPMPHYNQGNLFRDRGMTDEAISCYLRALALTPEFADAHTNLGRLLLDKGQATESVAHLRKATAASPDSYNAHNNLGVALHRTGRVEDAIQSFRRAIELRPASGEAHRNLGVVSIQLNQVEEAIAEFDSAIAYCRIAVESNPHFAHAHYDLANCYWRVYRLKEALGCYEQAIALMPDKVEYHWEYSLVLLLTGDYARGWKEYEWRWRRLKGVASRRFGFTPWTGERLPGGRLLLWGEQGIGDELIHASMVAELADAGLQVTLETDPRLVTLMQRSFPDVRVVARADPPAIDTASFDWQCPLAGLGRWLRPAFASFPGHTGYLTPDTARVKALAARLRGPVASSVIGVSWLSANQEYGAHKSTALSDWAEILRVPGTRFVDLQYGDTREAREAMRHAGIEIMHLDDLDLFNDLEGLAALCAACDLVITASNVTAHMAGALGKPVWLLVPIGTGRIWYWLAGHADSPWYPSMRVYSQQRLGSWREPFAEAARQLAAFVKGTD